MIELELDGKTISSEPGATILEVALREGKYIPHFCYHKKLSIAANCRMCLVEVEKAPKPLPACATPIAEGMKVQTCSKLAVEAQKGVMELLLINHPLDCPICDQGGECQLQDLAVGYGKSATRFEEEKRAVSNKDLGPLVSTEMTRCIHCSRCVRFTDEVGGYQELGMAYRNNHVEVLPFLGQTVDSEISGNIIDICPVGALTSKPFRNQARSWELSRRKSIAAHDGLGSNLIVQVDKYHRVVRVLPLENENINECWISDRDRFSYEGLYHEERVTTPMIKQDGKWIKVDWEVAIAYAAKSLNGVKMDHTSDAIGVLASANSTTEELYLLQKVMREIGVKNIDYRTRQTDFSLDGKQQGAQFLGSTVNDFAKSKCIFVIGSIVREEQPLLALRIRQAVKNGAELNVLNIVGQDLRCTVKNQIVVDPRELEYTLAGIVKATSSYTVNSALSNVEITDGAQAIAASLMQHASHIVLGDIAKSLPNYGQIMLLAQQLAKNIHAKIGIFAGSANEVGAQVVGFVPCFEGQSGLNAREMLSAPRRAYLLFNTELEHDAYNPQEAMSALKAADTVIVMSPYMSAQMMEYADVVLPISPYTETAGSFVNTEGKWQKFNGVTRPLGESKPAWKVLRVLANYLDVAGFEYNSIEDIRSELTMLDNQNLFSNVITDGELNIVSQPSLEGLIRFGKQSMYNTDSITRRAPALQKTKIAQTPDVVISEALALQLGVVNNDSVTVTQGQTSKKFSVGICSKVPSSVVVLSANEQTSAFASRFDVLTISRN